MLRTFCMYVWDPLHRYIPDKKPKANCYIPSLTYSCNSSTKYSIISLNTIWLVSLTILLRFLLSPNPMTIPIILSLDKLSMSVLIEVFNSSKKLFLWFSYPRHIRRKCSKVSQSSFPQNVQLSSLLQCLVCLFKGKHPALH